MHSTVVHQLLPWQKNIGPQEPFLANIDNKKVLLDVLMQHLHSNHIKDHQACGDADIMTVSVALKHAQSHSSPVAVLTEDTDILATLLYHSKTDFQDIYFLSEAKEGRDGKIVSKKCRPRLLQMHAIAY